ncbi:MAG: SRPBCC family protein [Bacteriovoracaceae bacterium]|jgi:ribosome-associated toxin RatA of RatAB toxin-antitoxin module|nr:SRPBCC family protein [Bacteriovoracaceae bacterium]
MASAERTEIMEASLENILSVLKDYEAYSEFMDGVSKVTVINRDGNKVKAKYDLNVIKKFSYTLNLEESETGISWSFDEGDIFSVNSGSWSLKDLGDGTTEVTYKVEVEIKVKMMGTGMITKKLVNTSLPSMMKSVEKRAQKL